MMIPLKGRTTNPIAYVSSAAMSEANGEWLGKICGANTTASNP